MGSLLPPTPIRLAILESDTPLPQTRAKYAGYGGVFTDLFTRACQPQDVASVLSLSVHHVVSPNPSYPSLDDIDAILITGSKHDAFEDGEDGWTAKLTEFTRRCLESERPIKVIGVCFGHQIVGRALGVPVTRSAHGWEVSVTEIRLTGKGKEVFGGRETLRIQQMHRDAVAGVPAGAVALAETDICPVQGFLLPGKAITVQGHPEFTGGIVREILGVRRETGVLSEEMYQSGVDRADTEHDGVEIARAFLRFLREE